MGPPPVGDVKLIFPTFVASTMTVDGLPPGDPVEFW